MTQAGPRRQGMVQWQPQCGGRKGVVMGQSQRARKGTAAIRPLGQVSAQQELQPQDGEAAPETPGTPII